MRDAKRRGGAGRKSKGRSGKSRPGSPDRAAKGAPDNLVVGNGSNRSSTVPPRRDRLVVRRVDPWSVLKISALFYLTMSSVALVAATVLWLGATATGVRGNIETFVADLIVSNEFRLSGPNLLRLGAIGSVALVLLGT